MKDFTTGQPHDFVRVPAGDLFRGLVKGRDTHIAVHGTKPSQDYYRAIAVAINSHLFERTHFYCDRLSYASTGELRVIENFQMAFLRTKGAKLKTDPLSAVQRYIDALESV